MLDLGHAGHADAHHTDAHRDFVILHGDKASSLYAFVDDPGSGRQSPADRASSRGVTG